MAGFIHEVTPKRKPFIPKDFRHSLCVGSTGCGKTSSFILPNMQMRMQENYGMFILDVKGNLHSQVKALAVKENRIEDVLEIGVPWGTKINIFKNISKTTFLNALNELNGEAIDKFWISSALDIADQVYDVFNIIQNIKDLLKIEEFSFFDYVFNPISLSQIFSSFDELKRFLNLSIFIVDELDINKVLSMKGKGFSNEKLHLLRQNAKDLKTLNDKLVSFYKSIDQQYPSSGTGGVFLHLKNLLHSFVIEGLNGENDIHELLESGKIIVLRCDTYDESTTRAFMNVIYTKLLQRDNDLGLSLFIDEFQRTISKENIPHVDLFREMKVELIAACQNIKQLENRLGENRCEEFLANVLHNYHYADAKENTLETFEFIYNNKISKAQPIFFDKIELNRAQLQWQISTKNRLSDYWIFHKPNGYKRASIMHVKTGEKKNLYILEKQDQRLNDELDYQKGRKEKEVGLRQ